MKYLYVSLSKPLKFGVWDEFDKKKPMGWYRAENVVNKDTSWNKLSVLTMDEICEIRQELKSFALEKEGEQNEE